MAIIAGLLNPHVVSASGNIAAPQAIVASADTVPPSTVPSTVPPTVPPTTDIVIDEANPFLPEDVDLTQCVGTLERPGCGSEARGGWHQNLVAMAMIGGLLIVFGRVAWGVRRSQKNLSNAD